MHLTKLAAIYKATCKMSYADCFGAALAKSGNAEFVTGDPNSNPSRRKSKSTGCEISGWQNQKISDACGKTR